MFGKMEVHGVEQIPSKERHGRPIYQFTLWFSSNLTVADYALGAILVTLGLSWSWVWIAIIIGNSFGAFLVGYLASYGPSFGLPQMMISKIAFGKKGNTLFSAAQWISTLGWFSVNAIISGYVLYYAYPNLPLSFFVFISAISQVIIAFFGYDVIHRSEYALSYILGSFFMVVLLLAIFSKPSLPSFPGFSPLSFAVALAAVFSYIMSWAPYASDYSRYLPEKVSRKRVIAYVTFGGALASLWMEAVGMLVSAATGNYTGLPTVLLSFLDRYGAFALAVSVIMIFLGALSANVLNLYSNSLSLLALYQKIKRKHGIVIGAVIGTALAVIGGLNFVGYFEGFLYFLDYWITPWIGVLAGALITGSFSANKNADAGLLMSYLISLLASVPFMNLQVATSGMINFVGPFASVLGGADVSYFVSFALGLSLSIVFKRLSL
ncbi:MAG: purine-cytosine permease family protein [Nitrososphaeria archaeon]|nr:cytosine permease [Conexivisphaerales archaeon]